jgi:hypothetical protein
MPKTDSENGSEAWKEFLRKHWSIAAIFVVMGIIVFAGAAYVLLWFVGNAQSTGLVPSSLGLWTMGNLVAFILYLVFWELLLIGVPAALVAAAGWLWWRRLLKKEKRGYHLFGKRSHARRGRNGIPTLLFIAFCIKVFIDGNWNVAIATWTLNYVVYSIITILIWMAVIFGIPIVIGLIWWVHHEVKKSP